jgi:hypothetical protein
MTVSSGWPEANPSASIPAFAESCGWRIVISPVAGHVTLLQSVRGLARIELVARDRGLAQDFWAERIFERSLDHIL